MPTTRDKIVEQARSWIGCKESDGSHRQIIDVYNSQPLARGWKMTYSNDWCAAFITSCAIKCNATDIIPKECSCNEMIALFKKLGCFIENDAHVPSPGDILFFDWNDKGTGDNTGVTDHVGIVEKVSGNTITVIDGNNKYGEVGRRTLTINGRYIRGYGVPKYEGDSTADADPATTGTLGMTTVSLPILCKGSRGDAVVILQDLLNLHGYTNAQKRALDTDGSFGPATQYALATFQSIRGLKADCICGPATWAELFKMND